MSIIIFLELTIPTDLDRQGSSKLWVGMRKGREKYGQKRRVGKSTKPQDGADFAMKYGKQV